MKEIIEVNTPDNHHLVKKDITNGVLLTFVKDITLEDLLDFERDKTRILMIEKLFSICNYEKGIYVPFILFPDQKRVLKSFAIGNTIVDKYRQFGSTLLESAYIACEMYFNKDTNVLSVGAYATQTLIKDKIREFLLQIPGITNLNFEIDRYAEIKLTNGSHFDCKSTYYPHKIGFSPKSNKEKITHLIYDEGAFTDIVIPEFDVKIYVCSTNNPNNKGAIFRNLFKTSESNENSFKSIKANWYNDPRYNDNLSFVQMLVIRTTEKDDIKTSTISIEPFPTNKWYSERWVLMGGDTARMYSEIGVGYVNDFPVEYIETDWTTVHAIKALISERDRISELVLSAMEINTEYYIKNSYSEINCSNTTFSSLNNKITTSYTI